MPYALVVGSRDLSIKYALAVLWSGSVWRVFFRSAAKAISSVYHALKFLGEYMFFFPQSPL